MGSRFAQLRAVLTLSGKADAQDAQGMVLLLGDLGSCCKTSHPRNEC